MYLNDFHAADCVESRVLVAASFALPPGEAECLLNAAISLLQGWQATYSQVPSHQSFEHDYYVEH